MSLKSFMNFITKSLVIGFCNKYFLSCLEFSISTDGRFLGNGETPKLSVYLSNYSSLNMLMAKIMLESLSLAAYSNWIVAFLHYS